MNWLRKRQWERSLDREMRFHLEQLEREFAAQGLSPAEARARARVEFGPVELAKDRVRDVDPFAWLRDAAKDVRFAFRTLRQTPAFALTAIAVLAVALAANTTLFTFFSTWVLRPLPVRAAGRNTDIEGQLAGTQSRFRWSLEEYRTLRRLQPAFEDLYAYSGEQFSLEGPQRKIASGYYVSENFFLALGVALREGRGFGAAGGRPDAEPVAVLSYWGWQRLFDGAPGILGRVIEISGRKHTVIGVTAREFTGLEPLLPDLFVPAALRVSEPDARPWRVAGIRRASLSEAEAAAAMQSLVAPLSDGAPAAERLVRLRLKPRSTMEEFSPELAAGAAPVFGAFLLVLLIACANLANLLLARAAARRQEITVRVALGASRWRLIRQLLTECLVLTTAAALAGLLLTRWLLPPLQRYVMSGLAQLGFQTTPVTLDWRVFVYGVLLALGTAVAFGLAPALVTTRTELAGGMREGRKGGGSSGRMRDALLVAQLAASLSLLVLAGLLARSAEKLSGAPIGYPVLELAEMRISRPAAPLLPRLHEAPFLAGVSLAYRAPLFGSMSRLRVASGGVIENLRFNVVDAEYFRTLSLPLERGRAFTAAEATSGAPVAVISARTARKLFPGGDALGRWLDVQPDAPEEPVRPGRYEVVGIAKDVVSGLVLQGADDSLVYYPARPADAARMTVLVRAPGGAHAAVPRLHEVCRAAVLEVPCQPLPLEDMRNVQNFPFEAAASVAAALGALALLLAATGLYGVVAYVAAQRTQEIGVRLALGAAPGGIVRLFLGRAARQMAWGLGIGLVVSLALSKAAGSFFFMLEMFDPATYLATPVMLAGVFLLASWLPARRASRVDPVAALRHE